MGSIRVDRSRFAGNAASASQGGGISAVNNGAVTVTRSEISNNSAPVASGGGIFFSSVQQILRLSASVLRGNSAASCGGVSFVSGAGLTAEDSLLAENAALSGNGGGLCVQAPPLIETQHVCVHAQTLELTDPFGDVAVVSPGQIIPNVGLNCSWLLAPPRPECRTLFEFAEIVPSGTLSSLITVSDASTVRAQRPSSQHAHPISCPPLPLSPSLASS